MIGQIVLGTIGGFVAAWLVQLFEGRQKSVSGIDAGESPGAPPYYALSPELVETLKANMKLSPETVAKMMLYSGSWCDCDCESDEPVEGSSIP